MSRRLIASTVFVGLALSACTTVSAISSPINSRWVGHSAGEFFAKYNPPGADQDSGSSTIYNWRGGYKKIKTKAGASASVSCAAKLTVSSDYKIQDITIIGDHPGETSDSYCTELLTEK